MKSIKKQGCKGNENISSDLASCQKVCSGQDALVRSDDNLDACDQLPKAGMCMAYFVRYYYNAKDNRCHKFIYGGCQGLCKYKICRFKFI